MAEELENMEFDEPIKQDNWEDAKALGKMAINTAGFMAIAYAASYALEKILEMPCKVLYQLGN